MLPRGLSQTREEQQREERLDLKATGERLVPDACRLQAPKVCEPSTLANFVCCCMPPPCEHVVATLVGSASSVVQAIDGRPSLSANSHPVTAPFELLAANMTVVKAEAYRSHPASVPFAELGRESALVARSALDTAVLGVPVEVTAGEAYLAKQSVLRHEPQLLEQVAQVQRLQIRLVALRDWRRAASGLGVHPA